MRMCWLRKMKLYCYHGCCSCAYLCTYCITASAMLVMALVLIGAQRTSLETDNQLRGSWHFSAEAAHIKKWLFVWLKVTVLRKETLSVCMILGSLLQRVNQPDSSYQTSPGEWGKFSLIAIRNRHSTRLSVSLGLNKDLDCCTHKQRSSLHDYATSQFLYLPTILFGRGGGEEDNFLCVWSKDVFSVAWKWGSLWCHYANKTNISFMRLYCDFLSSMRQLHY